MSCTAPGPANSNQKSAAGNAATAIKGAETPVLPCEYLLGSVSHRLEGAVVVGQ
jgi:hypothetical protein